MPDKNSACKWCGTTVFPIDTYAVCQRCRELHSWIAHNVKLSEKMLEAIKETDRYKRKLTGQLGGE